MINEIKSLINIQKTQVGILNEMLSDEKCISDPDLRYRISIEKVIRLEFMDKLKEILSRES